MVEEIIKKVKACLKPGSHPGLDRVRKFCDLTGHPEEKCKFIHVAGTNGKGSVSTMTALILSAAGYRTGLFTSPFLESPMEYFIVNGTQITEDRFYELVNQLLRIALSMEEPPTEFEFYTVAAMQYFAEEGCDITVLEAGMGGGKDATNVILAPELCLITNIGMDHEAYLGGSLIKITEEKAGIIKPGCLVAVYPSENEAVEVIRKRCKDMHVICSCADTSNCKIVSKKITDNQMIHDKKNKQKPNYDEVETIVESMFCQHMVYTTNNENTYHLELPTPAEYQTKNCALVLEGISILKEKGYHINDNDVVNGIKRFHLPARFEILSENPLIIADGGHNPQCMEALISSLRSLITNSHVIVLTCVMRDKNYTEMYRQLDEIADEYIAVSTGTERAMSVEELSTVLKKSGKTVSTAETPEAGVMLACKKLHSQDKAGNNLSEKGQERSQKCLLITGSLYMMAEVRRTMCGFSCIT